MSFCTCSFARWTRKGAALVVTATNPPKAMPAAAELLPALITCQDAYAACSGAEVLVIVTEWNQFRMLDLNRVKSQLKRPVIVDLRNIYDPGPMRDAGFVDVKRHVALGTFSEYTGRRPEDSAE